MPCFVVFYFFFNWRSCYQQRYKSLWQPQKKSSLFNQRQNIKWWLQLRCMALGTPNCKVRLDTRLPALRGYKQPLDWEWERNKPADLFIFKMNALTLSKCLLVSSSSVWKWMFPTQTSLKMEQDIKDISFSNQDNSDKGFQKIKSSQKLNSRVCFSPLIFSSSSC